MRIFSNSEKDSIKKQALKIAEDPSDAKKNYNLTELLMALKIIHRVLGGDWYKKAGEGLLDNSTKGSGNNTKPPIAKYLGAKIPGKYIRIIHFAIFLKNLQGKTNVQSKLKEYVRKENKKSTSISSDLFDSTYFELKIAFYLVENDVNVKFIREAKKPTPEFEASTKTGSVFIECKKRRQDLAYSLQGVKDSIERANNQLEKFGREGIVAVEISYEKWSSEIGEKKFQNQILPTLKNMPKIIGVWLLNEYTFNDISSDQTVIRTESHFFTNSYNKSIIPTEIMNSTKNIRTSQQSLYDD